MDCERLLVHVSFDWEREEVMGIFDVFKGKSRELMPLMYYRENLPIGRFAAEQDFSFDMAVNIVLFCKRLHKMGALSDDKIVRFPISNMKEMLKKHNLIGEISISSLNVVQIAFGEDYAGYWFRDKDGDDSLYMVPKQIAIYHTQRENNYYLCILKDGLDFCTNQISVSDQEAVSAKIGKGKPVFLGMVEMSELKSAFHILFAFLKYHMLSELNGRGYRIFINEFADAFFRMEACDSFKEYAMQYFLLNTEKKENYPLAHADVPFVDFLRFLILTFDAGIYTGRANLNSYRIRLEKQYLIPFPDSRFPNLFAFFQYVDEELKKTGKALYLLEPGEDYFDWTFLVGKTSLYWSRDIGLKLIRFRDMSKEDYADRIALEERNRRLTQEFCEVLGVDDLDAAMKNIRGEKVLDPLLYRMHYILEFDMEAFEAEEFLDLFFERYGIGKPASARRNAFGISEDSDEIYDYNEFYEASPVEIMLSFADDVGKKGKLPVCLDTGDSECFIIVSDESEALEKLKRILQEMIDAEEIESYLFLNKPD